MPLELPIPTETSDRISPLKEIGADPLGRSERMSPTFGVSETLGAAFELAQKDTALGAMQRFVDLDNAKRKGGRIFTKEELNKKYAGSGVEFEESMNEAAADVIVESAKLSRAKQIMIENGPQGAVQTGLNFGAAILAHAADPFQTGLAIASGPLLSRLGTAAVLGGPSGRLAFMAAKNPTAFQTFIKGSAEGLFESAITEIGVYNVNRQYQEDYNAADAMNNIMLGTFAFSGLRYGVHKVASWLRGTGNGYGVAAEKALVQYRNDENINIGEDLVEDILSERDSTRRIHTHNKIDLSRGDHQLQLNQRTLMVVSDPHRFPEGNNTAVYENYFGRGTQLVDNPNAANGVALSKWSSSKGSIYKVKISDAVNIIDLNGPLDVRVKNVLREGLSEFETKKRAADIVETRSANDVYETIRNAMLRGDAPQDIIDKINENLKAEGFDGLLFEGGFFLGKQHDPYNIVHLFTEEDIFGQAPAPRAPLPGGTPSLPISRRLLTFDGEIAGDPALLEAPTQDQAASMAKRQTAKENKILFDQEDLDALNEASKNPATASRLEDVKKEIDEFTDEIDSILGQGGLNKKAVEELKLDKRLLDVHDTIFKHLHYCMNKG